MIQNRQMKLLEVVRNILSHNTHVQKQHHWGCIKYIIKWYIHSVVVWKPFSHNVPDFYIAPLVRTLCSKDESTATQQFQARHRFTLYVTNFIQTHLCLMTPLRGLKDETRPAALHTIC